MSPRDNSDIVRQVDQERITGGPGRHLMYEGTAEQLLKGARPCAGDDDLAPAPAPPHVLESQPPGEDMPPPLPNAYVPRVADQQGTAAPPGFTDPSLRATITTADAAGRTSASPSAAAAASTPVTAKAAAANPDLIDNAPGAATAATTPVDATAGDCGYGGGDSRPTATAEDLPAAASAAASTLTRLASHAASRDVAGALVGAAQQLSSAFGGMAAVETGPDAAAPLPDLITQTASGRLAAVPSDCLDLRPHTGNVRSDQRLLAAAMASVGSLAKAAATRGSPGAPSGGGNPEGERALTSAATALERALEEISAAATDVVRMPATSPAEQEGRGLAGTGADKFPSASPAKVVPAAAAAAARDPASVAAVYGNVRRPGAAQPPITATAASPNMYGNAGRSVGTFSDEELFGVVGGGDDDVSAADARVPPGFQLELNATTAVLVPEPPEPGNRADVVEGATTGHYVYDTPDEPPPGAKGAARGFAGAADWAWEDPEVEAPAAPADGGLVPDSADAVHEAAVIAAADAMPSVIRDAADPASEPPGAAAAAMMVGGGGGSDAAAAAGVALLPDLPSAELDEMPREKTAEVTAAAVATIVPPLYVTHLPPHMIDMIREPSARDLSGVRI